MVSQPTHQHTTKEELLEITFCMSMLWLYDSSQLVKPVMARWSLLLVRQSPSTKDVSTEAVEYPLLQEIMSIWLHLVRTQKP
jgi:hypothetical protein